MEKKVTQKESIITVLEETIQNKESKITQNLGSFSCLPMPLNKKAELAVNSLQKSNFVPYEGIFQFESTKSVRDSIIHMGSSAAISPWVVLNQNNLQIDKYRVGHALYSPVFLGDHLNPLISKNQWAVTNFKDLDKSVFQILSIKSIADSIIHMGSLATNSPWVVSNHNNLENNNYKIGSAGYSAAFLGDPLNSYISTNPSAITNLRHIDKSVFQIERTEYSVADSMIRLSSHVASSPWVVSNQNNLVNKCYKTGSAGYSGTVLGNQLNSHISKSQCVVSTLSHFDNAVFQIESTGYSVADLKARLGSHILRSPWVDSFQDCYGNEAFKLGSVKYPNAGSIVENNSKHFESLWINPNLYSSEYGVHQVTKTKYPWLASNLNSWEPPAISFNNYASNAINITRSSIIEYEDKGLLSSNHSFRIYDPLDNYTLNALRNTIVSTFQKFKDHSPIQKYSLGFEKDERITVINIFIVQGDVIGDNHHFGDKNYYLTYE